MGLPDSGRGGGRGNFRGGRGGSFRGRGGHSDERRDSRGGFRGGGRGTPRGRGAPRGGRGAAAIKPHRFGGVFVTYVNRSEMLATRNLVPGESVYGEKRISRDEVVDEETQKVEYRVWNPFRSKLGAAVINGLADIHISPGTHVLYLGAASGTSVSHVSDIVGPDGVVYAVEFSPRSGRDLLTMAQKRPNIVPIVEDARTPLRYRMLMGMVDTIFSDVAQPDQARIVGINAEYYLKDGGFVVISVKCSCIDSTASVEAVTNDQVNKLREMNFKMKESCTLEPMERDHVIIVAQYRPFGKKNK